VALAIGVGAASVSEIDRLNIRRATALAMRRAIVRLLLHSAARSRARRDQPDPLPPYRLTRMPQSPVTLIIDGYAMPELGLDHEAIVDGDALCISISAAGIIAKTVRDRLMARLSGRYPRYNWVSNRGYATEAHCRALDESGPSPHHRRSFAPVLQLGLGLEFDARDLD
jgi:ribonuclease HII